MSDSFSPASGPVVIAAALKTMPARPGVYRMLDQKGDTLYVGKAKDLKKRVASYTRPEKQSLRIQRMIHLTAAMDCTVTETEAEALLLEANLIKKLKPRYNILLRDDKSFPYIRITGAHDFPRIEKYRGARPDSADYYGPFAAARSVNQTLDILLKVFQLRTCTDTDFAARTRPCLQYQIKRCTAPCVGKVTAAQYAQQVDNARRYLRGQSRELQNTLAKDMQRASDAQDYETAALCRDRIRALTDVQARQMIGLADIDSADIHALARTDGQACIQTFFFRGGMNYGGRAYFPRHDAADTDTDILSAFVAQFYATAPVPRAVMTSHALPACDAEALDLRAGRKVALYTPKRGLKKDLIHMALDNARTALARKTAADENHATQLAALGRLLAMDKTPARVEIYDNSHIQGRHALGAMVVTGPTGWVRAAFRRFDMPADIADDDYAMMRAMLARRFRRHTKQDGMQQDGDMPDILLPDILLIDGGKGQLRAATETLAAAGITGLAVMAIAKGPQRNAGRETFFITGRAPFTLPPDDPLLHFLQRLRDEAHRFAITTHRKKRKKAMGQNPLDSIAGIGGKRKKALLMHFGAAKAVAQAGVADLQKVTGISAALAETIYAHFHAKGDKYDKDDV